ncbi:MAG: hypothetical protein JWM85_328 [Acidimicrobiaceae bacterium]|nr:hypothetical protein [Acidimicrobiaceae bacterium]
MSHPESEHTPAGRLRCLIGRHKWGQHPAFDFPCVRQCVRCLRVEERCFVARRWLRVRHLDGLSEAGTRALIWQRSVAKQLNDQLQRRGDPRAIW